MQVLLTIIIFFSGYGLVATEMINRGNYVLYYSGKRLKVPPSSGEDDSYVFQIESKPREW